MAAAQAWIYRHRLVLCRERTCGPVPFLILLILAHSRRRAGWWAPRLGVQGRHTSPLVIAAAPFFRAGWSRTSCARSTAGSWKPAAPWAQPRARWCYGRCMPEAFTGLLAAITVTAIALVGYSAMSGVIGGGGLGDLAVRYGYQRFNTPVMMVTVAILVVLVQLIQWVGDRWVARLEPSLRSSANYSRNWSCLKRLLLVTVCLVILGRPRGRRRGCLTIAASVGTARGDPRIRQTDVESSRRGSAASGSSPTTFSPTCRWKRSKWTANFFQHKPYLDAFNRDHGTHIIACPQRHRSRRAVRRLLEENPRRRRIAQRRRA